MMAHEGPPLKRNYDRGPSFPYVIIIIIISIIIIIIIIATIIITHQRDFRGSECLYRA